MQFYDRVLNGQVVESKWSDELPFDGAHPTKGKWLARAETGRATYDPVTEVLEGPVVTIEADQVAHVYTVRPKTADECAAMAEAKVAVIETEYRRRNELPVTVTVDGVSRQWHADPEGVGNLDDVLFGIAMGSLLGNPAAFVSDPRPWKPYGQDAMVTVSHAGFLAIKTALASRKDANFVIQRSLKNAVRALAASGDAQGVNDFDPLDWG